MTLFLIPDPQIGYRDYIHTITASQEFCCLNESQLRASRPFDAQICLYWADIDEKNTLGWETAAKELFLYPRRV